VGDCGPKNNLSAWDSAMRENTRRYITAQLNTFEKNSQGWVFWTMKTENSHAAEWDLFALLDAGIFPSDLSNRPLVGPCA
jgi:glucan 1,3-beta-glucosidase